MQDLQPFLLAPEFHERVWGTRDLRPIYTRVVGPEPIGEAWLTGERCQVSGGPFAGRTLSDLARQYGADLTGSACSPTDRFPLLVKFLFPKDRLSVQVHPDDTQARAIGQACGKTECWYIAEAEPGAKVAVGLKAGTSKAELEQAVRENRAEHLMNWIEVKPGDTIYVEAGTLHAIGPGAIIVETQQNSDTTYRLYDYGRPRQLHVAEGLAATKERTGAGKVIPRGDDGQRTLVSSPCFVVEQFRKDKPLELKPVRSGLSPQILVLVSGSAAVEYDGAEPVSFVPGEAVVSPAACGCVRIRPQWEFELLRITLPVDATSQPEVEKHW